MHGAQRNGALGVEPGTVPHEDVRPQRVVYQRAVLYTAKKLLLKFDR
jgi:hypothetical protein